MNIGIIPRVRNIKKNSIEYSVDKKLIDILNKIYKKPKITIVHNYKAQKINLLVFLFKIASFERFSQFWPFSFGSLYFV